MSKKMNWSKFSWSDWARNPSLRLCSFAAKGLWVDLLCQMDASDERGFLLVAGRAASGVEIAKMIGGERRAVERLIGELETNGVFSRDHRGAIFYRPMAEEQEETPRCASPEWRLLRMEILERDDFTCRYCGDAAPQMEVDHVHPVSAGGTDDPQNLVAACRACNRSKGAKLISEWVRK
jgi:biotin operon repressor